MRQAPCNKCRLAVGAGVEKQAAFAVYTFHKQTVDERHKAANEAFFAASGKAHAAFGNAHAITFAVKRQNRRLTDAKGERISRKKLNFGKSVGKVVPVFRKNRLAERRVRHSADFFFDRIPAGQFCQVLNVKKHTNTAFLKLLIELFYPNTNGFVTDVSFK